MTLSTLFAGSSAITLPDALTEDGDPAESAKLSCEPLVLSAQAKERLQLLNKVLANCVPQSLGAHVAPRVETARE
jgi:hypothetical protein